MKFTQYTRDNGETLSSRRHFHGWSNSTPFSAVLIWMEWIRETQEGRRRRTRGRWGARGETQRGPTYTHEITHTCVTDCSPWIQLYLLLNLFTLVQFSGCLGCSRPNYVSFCGRLFNFKFLTIWMYRARVVKVLKALFLLMITTPTWLCLQHSHYLKPLAELCTFNHDFFKMGLQSCCVVILPQWGGNLTWIYHKVAALDSKVSFSCSTLSLRSNNARRSSPLSCQQLLLPCYCWRTFSTSCKWSQKRLSDGEQKRMHLLCSLDHTIVLKLDIDHNICLLYSLMETLA